MATIKITNLTDHPDQTSLLIDIYSGTLSPGESAQIDVDQINDKIIGLVDAGYLSIGEIPSYYRKWKFGEPHVFFIEVIKDSEPTEVPVIEDLTPTQIVEDASKKKKK